ncbi:MAG TPA: amidase [Planococcus sp. (in: firmicutes)]|nr:amidase [Planococcus sp. (in: firmicutes)]
MMETMELTVQSILDMDATQLSRLIAQKKITSRKAVEIFIAHIRKINPAVNCLVEDRFTEALEEAERADAQIDAGTASGKLFGVPIGMKEAFNVAGMQTTGGLLRRKGSFQQTDAEAVRKLRAEGAIILGKTNTPELCFCQETDNKLYGRTNNPHDLSCTAGGSSGGEAALIAAGGAAVGLGSDIGGSIRFPSHFNGVIGFKSGKGQVSSEGSYPAVEERLQERMLGIGPIAKTVRDARLLYSIVAKTPPAKKQLHQFTVNVLPKTGYPLSLVTAHLLDSIYADLSREFNTEREAPPYFEDSAGLWQEIMSIGGAEGPKREAFGAQPSQPIQEYIKERMTGTADIHRYLSWALIGASLFKPSANRVKKITKFIEHGDHILEGYFHGHILVLPVYHTGAAKHGAVYNEIFSLKKTFLQYLPYVAYANVWGLPALTVPVGIDENGMPIAVQLISKNGNEDALFELGEWLEQHYAGYRRAQI